MTGISLLPQRATLTSELTLDDGNDDATDAVGMEISHATMPHHSSNLSLSATPSSSGLSPTVRLASAYYGMSDEGNTVFLELGSWRVTAGIATAREQQGGEPFVLRRFFVLRGKAGPGGSEFGRGGGRGVLAGGVHVVQIPRVRGKFPRLGDSRGRKNSKFSKIRVGGVRVLR